MAIDIQYLTGDATNPIGEGKKIIPHICNDIGGWGKGFVLAISKRWKDPELQYKEWYKSKENFELGQIQLVSVTDAITIANIIGQRDIKKGKDGTPPIRYDAVKKGINKVAKHAKEINASIHMPRIGCGLAGGNWEEIEAIIKDELTSQGIPVFVYDFN
jgi:O-acetyl-ADP-ribose deacetylase (regulator of RNase III)